METKRFTVVDTRSNSTVVFESVATTVAELKADLQAHNIEYEGMSIQEGLTKTELLNDDSLLPHDVSYRGTTTNNLVFRLTQENRNVKSGIDRLEIYKRIKELGLEDSIKIKYGKNYTLVKTQDLINEVELIESTKTYNNEEELDNTELRDNTLDTLINILHDKGFLNERDMNCIYKTVKDTPYTKSEIEDMFINM